MISHIKTTLVPTINQWDKGSFFIFELLLKNEFIYLISLE